ncbi:MAG: hypothetical protein D3908_09405 [Candidatus Electrothrix sp. AUS4]|nr:hypothetical protein [Candidatus Electrothrix sp. AUS4]
MGANPGTGDNWPKKSDEAFAADYASMAFSRNLQEREKLAWMLFSRINQLIDDPNGGGMSGTGKVPVWLAWPTDPDTFASTTPFAFQLTPRDDMKPSVRKADLEAGSITTADPDSANEEVTRNKISYDYLINNGLTTKTNIATFFTKNDYVNMPVGSIELKASWLQVTDSSPAPKGALTYKFSSGTYWWRGLHIMVKMRLLADPSKAFYSPEPSWFWTTFEFNDNPGVKHVRDTLITQRAPLQKNEIDRILNTAGLKGFGFEAYAPNGTQISFMDGEKPVILGHTDMEDFAGSPNPAQSSYWNRFESSCHTCHATAAYNPETKKFFPFTVPKGKLYHDYNDGNGVYLSQGFKSLDFMWPIAFQAKK